MNRTNRSGILTGGPIGGLAQTGDYLINARYNRSELISRIERIAKRKKDINVYNKDVQCDWIITYDDVKQIEALYRQYPMKKMVLRYSVASTSPSGSEIMVFKNDKYCPSQLQLEQNKIKIKIV